MANNNLSAVINTKIDLTQIPKDKIYEGKKGKYLNITLFVKTETDRFGNNVNTAISQSKEEREAGEEKVYLGNGRVVHVKAPVTLAEREDAQASTPVGALETADALPF